ncbi:MAG: S9 family peptidase [Gammaproteobacteria bacterium]|nr:S9 family peptidase [Gammaproteobacteria bacterium]
MAVRLRFQALGSLLSFLLAGVFCAWADSGTAPQPPVARVQPAELLEHGQTRVDNYFWLRDDTRSSPEVLAYLEAENNYYDAVLAHTLTLRRKIYDEMAARIDPNDASVPVRHGQDWYYERYEAGRDYPIIMRRRDAADGPEEVVLDANSRVKPGGFYELVDWEVSEDGNLFAFSEDVVGREKYTARIRDLRSGELLADEIRDVAGPIAWANDNRTLFYLSMDAALRPDRVMRHVLGTKPEADAAVYEEPDTRFDMLLYKSRSRQFIQIYLTSTLSTETRLIDAGAPQALPVVFLPREVEHRHDVEPVGEFAWVRTNWQAPNYRLMRVPLQSSTDKSTWTEIVPNREDIFFEALAAFRNYLVMEETRAGSKEIRIIAPDQGTDLYIDAREPAFSMSIGANPGVDTETLRYVYSSLATPPTTFDYNMRTHAKGRLKQDFAGKDFDRNKLVTERVSFAARDGIQVPVTLLYKKGVRPNGRNPLFLLGYGAYGSTYFPEFNAERLSLVNRGFVFALAHVRGGQEYGRRWYEAGRTFNKKNTFTDFIDAARWLVQSGWAAPDRVVGMGRSAGGLLIGAVANMAPESFRILITEVPFVDVVTTMLDEGIPLTSLEFDEWGNPKVKREYDYMMSYSPYDQVAARNYPHMLVTTGLWDARVQYWEPAKWVAKLRAMKTDDNLLLLHTDMSAGHHGSYGRYQSLNESAQEFAFIFDTLGVKEP